MAEAGGITCGGHIDITDQKRSPEGKPILRRKTVEVGGTTYGGETREDEIKSKRPDRNSQKEAQSNVQNVSGSSLSLFHATHPKKSKKTRTSQIKWPVNENLLPG
ncbi:hypothetical protein P7K49_037643, partial [Saguinus oedipus]